VKGLSEAIRTNKIADGDILEVDLTTGQIENLTNGMKFSGDGVGELENDIMKAGGLFPYLKAKAAKTAE
jgi:3-isopropylmalate/(R)-2-methylmalate dehydratase small subunit